MLFKYILNILTVILCIPSNSCSEGGITLVLPKGP